MKKKLVSAILCLSAANMSYGENALNTLIERVLSKQLPEVLFHAKDIPWQYGHYNLHISKAGDAGIGSGPETITAKLPLKVQLSGKVKQKLFGQEIDIDCTTEFETNSEMIFKPVFAETLSSKLDMQIPIPETELDCQGLKLPIKPALEQLIAKEKPEWEAQAEAELKKRLETLGL
ncbi:DUF4403 family protein [Pseudoteredinibacter isoporae]|uniref:DUF1997 domain-containing protein n=1 Tax=Pseudoteredinibacter isoporae TaxID=570281 RepID=A0A7X0JQY5_9GAMM|nr:DUF4403 family protein [Pseudoteredinibacter isoporae]MBB6520169.1 hypothetical protein [Pseudoteredinibacter isoporae]NHO85741.1 hypothetical protein [Pseudoteredinibacter isoporae]NIB25807.1 hypothetical protein [Pseudoteredinibacter isoporae]